MIKYYKLFDLLNRRGLPKSELLKVVSSATAAKLSKNESVTTKVIGDICDLLNVQPFEIMENVKD